MTTTNDTVADATIQWANICLVWGRNALAAMPPHIQDAPTPREGCATFWATIRMRDAEGFARLMDDPTRSTSNARHFARLVIREATDSLRAAHIYPACGS